MAKLAKAGTRARSLALGFAAYFVLDVVLAYYLSTRSSSPWYDIAWTRWILAAYVLLGAALLAATCAAAVGRLRRLDKRLTEREVALEGAIAAAARAADAKASPGGSMTPPDDETAAREVDQVLAEIQKIGEAAAVAARAEKRAGTVASRATALGAEVDRLRKAIDAVPASAAGPLVAGVVFVGWTAPLLPAADGALLTNASLNSFVVLGGLGWLVGLAGYALAALLPRT